MKRRFLTIGLVFALGAACGFCGSFDAAELRGVTDRKDPASYKVGEPISFALSVCGVTNWPSAGKAFRLSQVDAGREDGTVLNEMTCES